MYELSCAAFLISLSKNSHYVGLTLCHPTWQLITIKSGTKKVGITHSAGGLSDIRYHNNNPKHLRQELWLSKPGQWTHLNKIKYAPSLS